ncbi:hypothetical protein EIP86_007205 [Pleurotus ostreatoroseus]|nr:hypothetical protein EIP86_007205 [Pleurotus ostreatoroseus]
MDPIQLSQFVAARTPGSHILAGLVLRHSISGQTLVQAPMELVERDELAHSSASFQVPANNVQLGLEGLSSWDFSEDFAEESETSKSEFESDTIETTTNPSSDRDFSESVEEIQFSSERTAAEEIALIALTDPGWLAVCFAVQYCSANLNATIVNSLPPDNGGSSLRQHWGASVALSAAVYDLSRSSVHVTIEVEAAPGSMSERYPPPNTATGHRHPLAPLCHSIGTNTIQLSPDHQVAVGLSFIMNVEAKGQAVGTRRGQGRPTNSAATKFPKLKDHAVVGIKFPSVTEDDDLSDFNRLTPLMLDVELRKAARSSKYTNVFYQDDDERRSSHIDDDYKVLMPARSRRSSMSIPSRGREPERKSHQPKLSSSSPPPPYQETECSSTQVLVNVLMGPRERSKRRASRPATDAMPRSPLSHTEHGFGFVSTPYHCPIEACGFSSSSSEHVRHHKETVRHSPLAKIHIRSSRAMIDSDARIEKSTAANNAVDSEYESVAEDETF